MPDEYMTNKGWLNGSCLNMNGRDGEAFSRNSSRVMLEKSFNQHNSISHLFTVGNIKKRNGFQKNLKLSLV